MLLSLYIENFALIDRLSLDFEKGFNVLTGETGAGKSIILGAINMILGYRASIDYIKTGAAKAYVEATFSLADNPALINLTKELNLHKDDNLIISREITESKSIAKINNRAITQAYLRQISDCLFDIHGQHQHQSLLNEENHLAILDAFGGSEQIKLRKLVTHEYAMLLELQHKLFNLQKDTETREKEIEFLKFQINEIETANLKKDEWRLLQEEQKLLKNAEKIIEKNTSILNSLKQTESPLNIAKRHLKELVELDSRFEIKQEEFENSYYILEDLQSYLQEQLSRFSFQPGKLDELNDRIDFIKNLIRKHLKITSESAENIIDQLLAKKDQMKVELSRLLSIKQDTSRLAGEINKQKEKLGKLCMELSMKRLAAAKILEKKICQNLETLRMEKSAFKVDFQQIKDPESGIPVLNDKFKLSSSGIDQVSFLISANPGEPPKSLIKIASGGELSRIMLAIKCILSETDYIPTMVFDEIDTGIGGATAISVADKLAELAKKKQVICVTHLPQIASKATHHLSVLKYFEKDKTFIKVKTLKTQEERKLEISRMLSGTTSSTTLKHAEEILKAN